MSFSELDFHHRLARPGTTVDVGANVGAFSAHFSMWPRHRLIAFEPFPPTFARLQENLLSGHQGRLPARVTLNMVAVGEAPGVARLRVPRTKHGVIHEWASLVKTFEGAEMEGVSFDEIEVPVWTIDGLQLDDLTAMKVDSEGGEIEVFHGARHTLSRCRPIISCELEERHREGITWYVPGFLKALGYDGFYHYQEGFHPISSLDRATMQRASSSPAVEDYSDPYIFEFYFVPRENEDLKHRLAELGQVHF